MNDENTEALFRMCARLYRSRTEQESLMRYGFACGDGWFVLIRDLSQAIERACDEDGVPVAEAMQVKEKLGGLRFYVSACTDRVRKLIERAEEDSFKVCEECGKEGALCVTETGWYRTVCSDHARELRMEPARERGSIRIVGRRGRITIVDEHGRKSELKEEE